MDGLFTLLSLSIVMAGASFLAGILPLSLSLSASQLRLISMLGMGILVGTSLIVIIPEGVETLYSSTSIAHAHSRRDVNTRLVADLELFSISASTKRTPRGVSDEDIDPFNLPGPVIPGDIKAPPKTPTAPGVVGVMAEEGGEVQEAEEHNAAHAWIGVALIAGFLLMYLIDKLPQYTNVSKPRPKTHHIALNNLGRRFNTATSLDREEEQESFLEDNAGTARRTFATTIGLVIHAAADGIALGASSSSANAGLSFIIFFAIMVHKAPAAFGLTSLLLKQGLSKRAARGHLLVFSLAAPTGALMTWMFAHLIGAGNNSAQTTKWWTGMLLLFSAGTFLYVAMHSMQETSSPQHDSRMNGNASLDGRENPNQEQKPSLKDLGAACFGMILPLFLQIGHTH